MYISSTAHLVMHECAVARNSAAAQGRSSAHTANTDKIIHICKIINYKIINMQNYK